MREVKAGWVEDAVLATEIEAGNHRWLADETLDQGGGDVGPTPHQLLLSALAACITLTLRLYAKRKGFPLQDARVHLTGEHRDGRYVIGREVILDGPLDAAQRARLMEISERCPVHRTLTGEVVITAVGPSASEAAV
jgi:putative redox protein